MTPRRARPRPKASRGKSSREKAAGKAAGKAVARPVAKVGSRTGRRRAPSRADASTLLAKFRDVLPRDSRAATRLAIRVIRAARAADNKVHELRGYWALYSAAAMERRLRAVLKIIDRALQCDAAIDDAALRARTTLGRGAALIHFGMLEEARREADDALPVLRAARDLRGQATAHELLANVAIETGCHARAIEHLVKQRAALGPDASALALAISEESEALCRVGLFEFADALRLFESAQKRFESVGAAFEAVHTRYNRAYLHMKSGRYADALRLYTEVAATFEKAANDAAWRALCVDRAELLLGIGAVHEARDWTARALESASDALSKKDGLRTRRLLASAALQLGDADAAFASASEVAVDFARLSDLNGAAESLVICSSAALVHGRAEDAARCARGAAAQFERSGAGAAACDADFALCRAAIALDRIDEASEALARAARRDGVASQPWALIELDRHRAMVAGVRGDHVGAAELLDRTVRDLDARRGLLPPDALRSAFLSLHAPLYREAVAAQVRVGRDERAFETATAAKSRALLDMIASGSRIGGSDAAELDRLRTDLGAAYARLHAMSMRPTEAADLAVAQSGAERIERRMARLAGESLNRRAGGRLRPAATSEEIRRRIGRGDVLVEYAFAAAGLHAFVVTRDAVRRVGLPASAAAVLRGVRKFEFHLAAAFADQKAASEPDALDLVNANLGALRRLLVDPLQLPRDVRRLIVAPDGALHGVPFHALPPGDSWRPDETRVVYAPSALVHASCLRRRPSRRGTRWVLAVPDVAVPAIRKEARIVAKAMDEGAEVRVGRTATWEAFVEAARTGSVIHVATHGMSRSDSVIGGSVRLADSWLTQFDLHRIPVCADLVVLSACDSGAARLEASGDQFGLARGFLCAGARALIASRWRIDDRTTAQWMATFYSELGAGRGVGDAYAVACAETRRRRPHPFHWAPFVLTGDPDVSFSF